MQNASWFIYKQKYSIIFAMIESKKNLENISSHNTDLYKQDWRLKLDSNENIYGCSNNIISAIKNIPNEEISLYPTYGKLKDKFSEKYKINKDNILFSNGCNEALDLIITAYLENDEEILSLNPTFSMLELYTKINGAKTKYIDYDEKFIFNKNKLEESITQNTKIIYISTPNNPTGELIRPSILEPIIDIHKNILFIIDCTYINFSYSATFEDYIELEEKYDNVAIIKSFSIDFAIAGLRLGVIIANSSIIKNLKKIISPYSVNAISVHCGLSILNDSKRLDEIKELNFKAKEFLAQGLKNAGFEPYPSEANFILCDFKNYNDFYYEKFKKYGVITKKFPKNSSVNSCLRITVPTIGGVKYILELLTKKDVLIFGVEDVIFDDKNSYQKALCQTYSSFINKEITIEEIYQFKKINGINHDFSAIKFLLEKENILLGLDEIIKTYKNLFYNPKIKKEYLIDNDKLLISKEILEELSKKYDLVLFTNRYKNEIEYSLKKYNIDKYFYYCICADDLSENEFKPSPKGVIKILQNCPYKNIKYIGGNIDDIIAANMANIETIATIPPNSDYNKMINNYRHIGAKYILNKINDIEDFIEELENKSENQLA